MFYRQSVDLLEQQNYDEIKSMIDGAMNPVWNEI